MYIMMGNEQYKLERLILQIQTTSIQTLRFNITFPIYTILTSNYSQLSKRHLKTDIQSYHFPALLQNLANPQQYFKMMNFHQQQMNNWQLMYFQLLNQYSSLAHNYHQQTENNNALYKELEQAMEEKVALLQGISSPMPTQVSLPLPQPQEEEPQQASPDIPRGTKVKRHVGSMRRNGQKYKCKRHNCDRSYHTLMSLRQHLKSQHGRHPKRNREARLRKNVA